MRALRIFGLAALTISIVMLYGGSASATVLCKTNTTPCSSQVSGGTKVEMSLSGVSTMKALSTDECSGSTLVWKVENAGSSTSTVSGKVETLEFTGCSCTTKVLKAGEAEVHWVGGTMNGTLTSKNAEVTASCAGIDCVYGTGAGTSLGTLTGGEAAKLDVSATLAKISGAFCASTDTWTATYEVKAPKPLYVAEWMSGEGPTSTSLTTSLSGEAKSGEEITVNEGSKVKDTATLSGTNASKATGTVKYKVYADKECKELVTSAGEVTVTSGSVPASEEKTLEAGRVYYWQAEYSGDSNNLSSVSTCGKEVATVKAKTTLTTTLRGEPLNEEPVEGEEISLPRGVPAIDTATFEGTNSSTATGSVVYKVYADAECKELVAEAGEASVEEGKADSSEGLEVELEEGTYYWQASYGGDPLHQASTSLCGKGVLTVKAAITIATVLLTAGEETGEIIEPEEELAVTGTAILSGAKSSVATGNLEYSVYADAECQELVAEAGEVAVSEGEVPASEPITLEPGIYFWRAHYMGDTVNSPSTSSCGAIEQVDPADVTLREDKPTGAALAVKSKIEGSSGDLPFQTVDGGLIECSENKFVGEIQKNGQLAAFVKLTSWEFKNGVNRCKTTMKIDGQPVTAVVTPLNLGNVQVRGAYASATKLMPEGFLSSFEIKLELYVKDDVQLTCRYGAVGPAVVSLQYKFNDPWGLQLAAIGSGKLNRQPSSQPKCGMTLSVSGLFDVTTEKPGSKKVVPTAV